MFCRICVIPFLASSACAQNWFHQAQFPGALGDLTHAERKGLRAVDPGIEGSARAVGHSNIDFGKLLHNHGDERNDHFGIYPPSRWEEVSGQRIVNATPINISGSTVVRTDHGLMPVPMVWSTVPWRLEDRPRKLALMVIEMIEDYRPFLGYLVPKVETLLRGFRARGLPVFFSNWAHRPDDGLYGALDRATGFKGLSSDANLQYTYSKRGLFPMSELMPTDDEVRNGHFIKSIHLDKFADLDPTTGKSILSEKLRAHGVDTLVLVGGFTDACIVFTAMDAVDTKNLDVVLVTDAIGTSTSNQQAVLKSFRNYFLEQKVDGVLDYLRTLAVNLSSLARVQNFSGSIVKLDASASTGDSKTTDVQVWKVATCLAVVFLVASITLQLKGSADRTRRSNLELEDQTLLRV